MTFSVIELCQRMSNLPTQQSLAKLETSVRFSMRETGLQLWKNGSRSHGTFPFRLGRLQGNTTVIKCGRVISHMLEAATRKSNISFGTINAEAENARSSVGSV